MAIVRVFPEADAVLAALAERLNTSKAAVLDRAIYKYRKTVLFCRPHDEFASSTEKQRQRTARGWKHGRSTFSDGLANE